jgi:SagB-type dehydrogenase family enzyme
MFRDEHPAAWLFHQNTVRWPFNTIEADDEPWAGALFKEYLGLASVTLPALQELHTSLSDAVGRRVSCRNFAGTPMALDELSTILAVGYGVTGAVLVGAREHLERPVPSGGGLYPLELYVLVRNVDGLEPGLYHYAALTHTLDVLKQVKLSSGFVSQLFMNQPYLDDAGAIVLMAAVVERSLHKYGERGYRYLLLEAGHVGQSMCLVAAALEIGALPIGGFFDAYLSELLGLDSEEEAILYGLAVGRAASDDRVAIRNLSTLLEG